MAIMSNRLARSPTETSRSTSLSGLPSPRARSEHPHLPSSKPPGYAQNFVAPFIQHLVDGHCYLAPRKTRRGDTWASIGRVRLECTNNWRAFNRALVPEIPAMMRLAALLKL